VDLTVIKSPVRSPQANALCERLSGRCGVNAWIGLSRWPRSICDELCARGYRITIAADHTLPWGPGSPIHHWIFPSTCNASGIASTGPDVSWCTPS
jgi:hypothetical protein